MFRPYRGLRSAALAAALLLACADEPASPAPGTPPALSDGLCLDCGAPPTPAAARSPGGPSAALLADGAVPAFTLPAATMPDVMVRDDIDAGTSPARAVMQDASTSQVEAGLEGAAGDRGAGLERAAFPGAQGLGKDAVGGRNGEVYIVTRNSG